MSQTRLRQKIGLVFLGIALTFIFLEIFLNLGGLLFRFSQNSQNKISNRPSSEYRILCIGESTTAMGGQNSYPSQLQNLLNKKSKTPIKIINCAIPSYSTFDILTRLEYYLDRYQPQAVIAMIGINDREQTSYYFKNSLTNSFLSRLSGINFKTLKLGHLLWMHLKAKKEEIKIRYRYQQAIKKLEGEAASYPTSLKFIKLSEIYHSLGDYPKEKEILFKAIEINPRNYAAYLLLSKCYQQLGEYPLAEEAALKAIEYGEKDFTRRMLAVSLLGDCYTRQGKYTQAENIYLALLQNNTLSNEQKIYLYESLTNIYIEQDKFEMADFVIKSRLAIDHENARPYVQLAYVYRRKEKLPELEEILRKAIEQFSQNSKEQRLLIAELGYCLQDEGKTAEAKVVFEKLISQPVPTKTPTSPITPVTDFGLGRDLSLLKENNGGYAIKSKKDYCAVTIHHYLLLKNMLSERHIKLFAMQYPMRSMAPLKRILGNDPTITFIDNEELFNNAVLKSNYTEYFSDHFAGDFGHCTPKGNRLLAENIAQVILQEPGLAP